MAAKKTQNAASGDLAAGDLFTFLGRPNFGALARRWGPPGWGLTSNNKVRLEKPLFTKWPDYDEKYIPVVKFQWSELLL